MIANVHASKIELVEGDITDQQVDAIVNAANRFLAGGAGVDGAIHARGGPTIMQETKDRYPGGCPTGSAVITNAGQLRAKYVMHAVGPVWDGGHDREGELLASAHRTCLQLAMEHECKSIAFPAISTGVYGYPIERAARVAIAEVTRFLNQHGEPDLVRFVLFDAHAFEAFAATLQELVGTEE